MAELPPERITEPRALRALSHPTRLAIIELLALEGTATATRCAEQTGESVASCSYHLGMLAKYGFVEQADGGQGREKPWKSTRPLQWGHEGMNIEGERAAEALSEVYLDHVAGQMKDSVRRSSLEPDEWRRHLGSWSSVTHLTVTELAELTAEFAAIAERFRDRIDDPDLRPEGSRPVRMFLTAFLPRPPR